MKLREGFLLKLTTGIEAANDLHKELLEVLSQLVTRAETRQRDGDRGLWSHRNSNPRRYVADVSLVAVGVGDQSHSIEDNLLNQTGPL